MDERGETTAAFLSICMSGQGIRRVNLIWSQRMNQVRTFLCSCGEARGMRVEERFLLPFPIRVQHRRTLCFYSQSTNFCLLSFSQNTWSTSNSSHLYGLFNPYTGASAKFFDFQIILTTSSLPSFPGSKRNRPISVYRHVGGWRWSQRKRES